MMYRLCFAVVGLICLHAILPSNGDNSVKFGVDLYESISKSDEQSGKNVAISPFSVEAALTMAMIGAAGTTKSEMASVMSVPANATTEGLGGKFKSVSSPSAGYILSTVYNSFVEQTFPILPQYKSALTSQFSSAILTVDFKHHADKEREVINSFVAGKTNGKIQELLPSGLLDSATKLVLVSAVYFKANWSLPFPAESTLNGVFDQTKRAEFMRQVDDFFYTRSQALGGAQLLEMTYRTDEISMVIVLPKEPTGLRELETSLTSEALEIALNNMTRRTRVDVTLPKFKVEAGYSLKDYLVAMGMKEAFADSADFSGISSAGIKISAVEHKVFVEANERGTEAAAATAVVMMNVTMALDDRHQPKPVIFRADHPFLFLIRHNPSGAILFLGRITNPTLAENPTALNENSRKVLKATKGI